MARVVWKGAIVFGLVHVPVDLYPGSRDQDLDFDWIDKRDNAPVGYQRINKVTGEPIEPEHVVKGYEIESGHYVVLRDEDFKAANPKATQTVEILAFVDADAIAPQYFERPYRLVPGKRGEKGYALLRETLKRTGKAGVAQVVIRNRAHLAILLASGPLLALVTVRWADEVLGHEEFALPGEGRASGVTDKELELAQRLVEDMSEPWEPSKYSDSYRDDLLKRIEALAGAGDTHVVKQASRDEAPASGGAQIIDLMAALRRSLDGKDARPRKAAKSARASAKRAASAKARSNKSVRTAARKRA